MATTGSVYQRGTRSSTQAHPHEYPPTGVAATAGCAGALRALVLLLIPIHTSALMTTPDQTKMPGQLVHQPRGVASAKRRADASQPASRIPSGPSRSV